MIKCPLCSCAHTERLNIKDQLSRHKCKDVIYRWILIIPFKTVYLCKDALYLTIHAKIILQSNTQTPVRERQRENHPVHTGTWDAEDVWLLYCNWPAYYPFVVTVTVLLFRIWGVRLLFFIFLLPVVWLTQTQLHIQVNYLRHCPPAGFTALYMYTGINYLQRVWRTAFIDPVY